MRITEEDLTDNVLAVFRELNRRGVKYMVVGMAGAIMQGASGTTKDIDIWFRSYTEDAVLEAFKAVGGVMIWMAKPPVVSGRGLDVFDVVYGCSGLESFEREYERAVPISLQDDDVEIPVLPLDRIIRSKTAADRPKDRATLPMLKDTLKILKSQERK